MIDPNSIRRGDTITMETPDGRRFTGEVQDVTFHPHGGCDVTLTSAPPVDPAVLDLLNDGPDT